MTRTRALFFVLGGVGLIIMVLGTAGMTLLSQALSAPPAFLFPGPDGMPRAPYPDELVNLEHSFRPGDRKVAAEIRDGARALPQERALAEREGLPTRPAQLQEPLPPLG